MEQEEKVHFVKQKEKIIFLHLSLYEVILNKKTMSGKNT